MRTSYTILKDQLRECLAHNVEISPGGMLWVDELVERLQRNILSIKLMPQKSLLASISSVLGANVQRKGKKRQ